MREEEEKEQVRKQPCHLVVVAGDLLHHLRGHPAGGPHERVPGLGPAQAAGAGGTYGTAGARWWTGGASGVGGTTGAGGIGGTW